MDERTSELLQSFACLANVTALHPLDWNRFFAFVVHVHLHQGGPRPTESDVAESIERLGFPENKARELARVYNDGLDLLTYYDTVRER